MANPTERDEKDGPGPTSSDDAALSARLKSLETRLGQAADQRERDAPRSRATSDSRAVGQAFRLSAEFVAGVVAGGTIGWLVDKLAGTSPWGLIVLLILGFFAGMLNLLRAAGMVAPAKWDAEDPRGGRSDRPEDHTDS